MPKITGNDVIRTDKCPSCGELLRAGSQYCPVCGQPCNDVPVKSLIRCKNCHAILSRRDRYCQVCGVKTGYEFDPEEILIQCLYGPMPFDDDTLVSSDDSGEWGEWT